MQPGQPSPRPTTTPPAAPAGTTPTGIGPGGRAEGFHTIAEALRGAAREIDTARHDAQKLHLPPPPKTSVVGDARAAEELRTSTSLHDKMGRWAKKEMAAMVPELRATADGYTDTEDHNTQHLTPHQHPGSTQHPGAPRSHGKA